jgi:HPt (histidine-containing phosphotransfer) domain-containing protein
MKHIYESDENEEVLLDIVAVEMLRNLGDESFYKGVVDTYATKSHKLITSLPSVLSSGDASRAQSVIHDLKGSSGNVGAKQIAELCITIEGHLKNDNLAKAESLLDGLDIIFEETLKELQKYA